MRVDGRQTCLWAMGLGLLVGCSSDPPESGEASSENTNNAADNAGPDDDESRDETSGDTDSDDIPADEGTQGAPDDDELDDDDEVVCGNGVVEEGEACDDGNEDDNDGCVECAVTPGWKCEEEGFNCEDIDECGNTPNPCGDNATCENTPGSFECTCNWGSRGAGYGECVSKLQFGTEENDFAASIAVDASGNVYVAGVTTGSLEGDNRGSGDAILRKIDSSGNVEWTRQFGTEEDDSAMSVAVDTPGNLYVAGSTAGSLEGDNRGGYDAMLRKVDSSGNVEWTRQFGTEEDDFARSVAVDTSGDVYVAGSTAGSLEGDNLRFNDAMLRKYDSSGSVEWTRQFGTEEDDFAYSVAVDTSGNVYVAGKIDGSLWGDRPGNFDAMLRKYDSSGDVEWTRQFGTEEEDTAWSVAVDASGNVYVAGDTFGSLEGDSLGLYDAILRKYDSSGDVEWTRQFGTESSDSASSVAVDASGNVYVAGDTYVSRQGDRSGNHDAMLHKYDSAGIVVWSKQFGTENMDSVHSVAVDVELNAYFAGATSGSLAGPSLGLMDVIVLQVRAADRAKDI